MPHAKGFFITMMTVNAVGIALYLAAVASCCWIEPELANVPGASGGMAFIWVFTAFPIYIFFGLLNALWVLFACGVLLVKKKWILHPLFLLVPLCWALAIYLDFSRHGM